MASPAVIAGPPNHASIFAAIGWQFTQSMVAEHVPAANHPQLADLAAKFEALPLFQRWPPDGPGVPTPVT